MVLFRRLASSGPMDIEGLSSVHGRGWARLIAPYHRLLVAPAEEGINVF
jgi:hypothetical protein